jgi:hypothetical protein
MRGVFSVGGRDSLMVMRKTVMESRAEIPRVTYAKKRQLSNCFLPSKLKKKLSTYEHTNHYKMFL